MGSWVEAGVGTNAVDAKLFDIAVVALKHRESSGGYTARGRNKLQ